MELTKIQQLVCDFYSEHPGATRIECCRAVYGKVDVFFLLNLAKHENNLRKKGFLFYSVEGQVYDVASNDTPISKRLRVQKKVGNLMLGFMKSNINIIESVTEPVMLQQANETIKEANTLLLKARNYANRGNRPKKIEARPRPAPQIQKQKKDRRNVSLAKK